VEELPLPACGVHGFNGVRQSEMHSAETLVPEPSTYEVGIAIENLKRYKLPGTDQIPTELMQAGGNTLHSEIHKLINCIWKKENCQSTRIYLLLYVFVRRVIKLTALITQERHCCQLHTQFFPTFFCPG
jgi:hypothetical protein